MIKAAAGHKPWLESTKLLMVGKLLTRCLGYFKCENTVLKWSHLSVKCDEDEDKRCARSSIVVC